MVELILLRLGVGSGVLFLLLTCTHNCECCNEYLASQSRTLTRQNSGVILARSVQLCVMASIAAVCAKCLHTGFSGLDLISGSRGCLKVNDRPCLLGYFPIKFTFYSECMHEQGLHMCFFVTGPSFTQPSSKVA